MPGSIDFLVWYEDKRAKHIDPSVHALVMGGNVGHAAIKMVIPKDELPPNALQKLKESRIPISSYTTRIMKDDKVTQEQFYEIYFSFWPAQSKEEKNYMAKLMDDTLGEYDGREHQPSHRLKDFFHAKDIKQMFTNQRDNIFAIIRNFGVTRKKIFSGIKSIIHISEKNLQEMTDRAKEKVITPRVEVLLKTLNSPGFTMNREDTEKTFKELNELITLNHQLIKIRAGNWDEKNIPAFLNALNNKIQEIEQKTTPSQEEVFLLQELKKDVVTINNNWTLGINADASIPFKLGQSNFDPEKLIDVMCDIANNKKYSLIGWNCSSTALFALLKSMSEELHEKLTPKPKEKLNTILKEMNSPNPPIYTPFEVKKIAQWLQTVLVKGLCYQVREKSLATKIKQTFSQFFRAKKAISEKQPLLEPDRSKKEISEKHSLLESNSTKKTR